MLHALKPLFLIAAKDLTSRLRDRSALVTAFVAPITLALIISAALGRDADDFHARVGLVGPNDNVLVRAFRDDVLGSDELAEVFTPMAFDEEADARGALESGELAAVFVFSGNGHPLRVLRSPRALTAGLVAESVARHYVAEVDEAGRGVGLMAKVSLFGADAFDDSGFAPGQADFPALDQATLEDVDFAGVAGSIVDAPLPIRLVEITNGGAEVSSASYYGPGMAILFVFFTLSAGPRSLLAERRMGTLARLQGAPISPVAIVGGKALAVGLLALVSMGVVWLITALVFGAYWGDPLAVIALLLALVFSVLGITTLIAVLARTESQVDAYVAAVAFVMAMLGGNFVEIANLPETLQTIALLTPNGWAMQGFVRLTADGVSLAGILPNLAAIVLFGIVALSLAWPGMKRLATS